MSLLGKYTDNFIEDEELDNNTGYTTPAVLKNDEEISLKQSIIISSILHPTVIGIAWLIVFILALLGITFTIFDKPKPKMNDIEFVLVDKEDTPINKNTPYRADINSRAGGHHDPTRKVSMPSPSPGAPQKAAPKPAAQPKQNALQKMVQQATQQAAPKKPAQQPAQGPKKAEQAKPAPPTARPSIKPPMTPKVVQKPSSAFTVPVPKGGTGAGAGTALAERFLPGRLSAGQVLAGWPWRPSG